MIEILFKITFISLAIVFFPITLGFRIWGIIDNYRYEKTIGLLKDLEDDAIL